MNLEKCVVWGPGAGVFRGIDPIFTGFAAAQEGITVLGVPVDRPAAPKGDRPGVG